jgi:hypothetical protein
MLKLVPFVTPTSARKHHQKGFSQKPFPSQHPADCPPFCLIFRLRNSETAVSVFKALESRQKFDTVFDVTIMGD